MNRDAVLDDMRAEIVARFGDAVRVEAHAGALVLRDARHGAEVGVTVDDAGRPSFGVSYPGFDPDATSWRELRERTATGVLREGVLWLVRAVVRDGAVLPEFPHAGIAAGRAAGDVRGASEERVRGRARTRRDPR